MITKFEQFNEEINVPVKVGDTILRGKFKNVKVKVKKIGKDQRGQPTINGLKMLTFRMLSKAEKEKEKKSVDEFNKWEESNEKINNEGEEFNHYWYWKSKLGDRNRKKCKVIARGGRMNTIVVEFEDGHKVSTSRHAVRKITPKTQHLVE